MATYIDRRAPHPNPLNRKSEQVINDLRAFVNTFTSFSEHKLHVERLRLAEAIRHLTPVDRQRVADEIAVFLEITSNVLQSLITIREIKNWKQYQLFFTLVVMLTFLLSACQPGGSPTEQLLNQEPDDNAALVEDQTGNDDNQIQSDPLGSGGDDPDLDVHGVEGVEDTKTNEIQLSPELGITENQNSTTFIHPTTGETFFITTKSGAYYDDAVIMTPNPDGSNSFVEVDLQYTVENNTIILSTGQTNLPYIKIEYLDENKSTITAYFPDANGFEQFSQTFTLQTGILKLKQNIEAKRVQEQESATQLDPTETAPDEIPPDEADASATAENDEVVLAEINKITLFGYDAITMNSEQTEAYGEDKLVVAKKNEKGEWVPAVMEIATRNSLSSYEIEDENGKMNIHLTGGNAGGWKIEGDLYHPNLLIDETKQTNFFDIRNLILDNLEVGFQVLDMNAPNLEITELGEEAIANINDISVYVIPKSDLTFLSVRSLLDYGPDNGTNGSWKGGISAGVEGNTLTIFIRPNDNLITSTKRYDSGASEAESVLSDYILRGLLFTVLTPPGSNVSNLSLVHMPQDYVRMTYIQTSDQKWKRFLDVDGLIDN